MGWPSRASIERTDRMLVFMGPVSLVVGYQQELDLRPLLHWLAQERNWVWTHRSISQRAVDCVGNPFSREQWDPSKSVGVSQKVAIGGSREICMVLDHTRTERGKHVACWSGFPLHGVHLSKWLCDTSTGAATEAARCGYLVGEDFGLLVLNYR
jgi:hypothetical protein